MRPMRGWLSGGVRGVDAFWWWSTISAALRSDGWSRIGFIVGSHACTRRRARTPSEECETEYDQLRQGSLDFEWGSFLCAPVRSGARAVGEAATEGLDGHTHDYDRYERHGQPSEPFVARAARA